MKPSSHFILLVFGCLVATVALLAPRQDEWIAVLLDEGKQGSVIALLEPRLTREPDNPQLLSSLARSYAHDHRYGDAIGLMKRYAALKSEDSEAYARLADLYQAAGDGAGEAIMLRRTLEIKQNVDRLRRLVAIYRRADQNDQERELLIRHESGLVGANDLLLRLAQLKAEGGDPHGAIRILSRAAAMNGNKKDPDLTESQLLLASLLVRSGQTPKALDLGRQWIKDWDEPWLANRLLIDFVSAAPEKEADMLADAVVLAHPAIRLFVVDRVAGAGARPVARHVLSSWIDANRTPSNADVAAFLFICQQQESQDIAWQTFGRLLRKDTPAPLIAQFIKAMTLQFGIGAIAPFWRFVPPSVIATDQVLAAQLAFNNDDIHLTRGLLSGSDLTALTSVDQKLWVSLLIGSTSPDEALPILGARAMRGVLPAVVLAEYLRHVGQPREAYPSPPAVIDSQTGQ